MQKKDSSEFKVIIEDDLNPVFCENEYDEMAVAAREDYALEA